MVLPSKKVCICSMTSFLVTFAYASSFNVTLKMPGVRPEVNDAYVCTSYNILTGADVNDDKSALYITSYKPIEAHPRVHHMALYTCIETPSAEAYWYCGDMNNPGNKLNVKPICLNNKKKIYVWAMDAPGLSLPPNVSFKVGGNTRYKHIILQVHYKDKSEFVQNPNLRDESGLVVTFQNTPTDKLAGIAVIITHGFIPANSIVYMEAACKYTNKKSIYPFLYRTHSHSIGKLTVGYRVRGSEWLELGRKSPQDPQTFYNITNPNEMGEIRNNDYVAARCIMDNTNNSKPVAMGPTSMDEMCNFYIMYWVYAENVDQIGDYDDEICYSSGYPSYNWCDEPYLNCSAIPTTANVDPRTGKSIEQIIANVK